MHAQQIFEIIVSKSKRKFSLEGRDFTLKALEKDLGLSQGKLNHWKNGQLPSAEDMAKLCRYLDLNPAWILLGVGEPVEIPAGEANPAYVHIADTLSELLGSEPNLTLGGLARAGGMTTAELNACLNCTALPSPLAIARWVRAFRINANFLLAQAGRPLLSRDEYQSGPLANVREELEREEDLDPERWSNLPFIKKLDDDELAMRRADQRPDPEPPAPAGAGKVTPMPTAQSVLDAELAAIRRHLEAVDADKFTIQEAIRDFIRGGAGKTRTAPAGYSQANESNQEYSRAAEEGVPYGIKKPE